MRTLLRFAAAMLWLAAALGASAATKDAPVYHDRSNLLVLQAPDGTLRPIRTRKEWEQRRGQILLNMQKVMGPLPGPEKRVPLDVRVEREERLEKYVLRKLSYASAQGERVPAYLLLPAGPKKRRPAALCLQQTTNIGKDEPVGLGGSANLHYGRELAERGYVVLAPDYPTFGEHQIDVYARGWQSGSMKAVWDNVRGLDLLQSLPEIDGNRIACLGHSLGGHNTLFTSAFDRRIKAAISNCGFTAFGKYHGGDIAGWTGPRYMPRIKTLFPIPAQMPFDFHEVIAAIAPRAFLAIAPDKDSNFDQGGVREVMAAAKPVYQLLGHPERLEALYPEGVHDWPPGVRQQAYRWLDQALGVRR